MLDMHKEAMRKKLYDRAIKTYGIDAQLDQTIEEAAELIVAINHLRRNRVDQSELITELADVSIMIEQIVYGYNLYEKVDNEIDFKMARLEQRMDKREQSK